MPQAMTRPRCESSRGRTTAASPGPSLCNADQRLDHAAALHFVVVLADDPFLAGHVQRTKNLQQSLRVAAFAGCRRTLPLIRGDQLVAGAGRRPRGRRAGDRRAGTPWPGRPPACRSYFSTSRPVSDELADHRGLDAFATAQSC